MATSLARSNRATDISDPEGFVYELIKERQNGATRKEVSILLGDVRVTRRAFDLLLSQKRIKAQKAFADGSVEIRYTIVKGPSIESAQLQQN